MFALCSPSVIWVNAGFKGGSCGSLRGAGFLCPLGFCSNGRFLRRRSVCGLSFFALAFQAQFDKVLPKLAVVYDCSLQREELLHGSGAPGFYWAVRKIAKRHTRANLADGRRIERQH